MPLKEKKYSLSINKNAPHNSLDGGGNILPNLSSQLFLTFQCD